MNTSKTAARGASWFGALALTAATCGSAALQAAEVSRAAFENGAARAHVVKTAAPKAPAGYTEKMIEELREAEAAQRLMPYLLALHVDGTTADGITVRINVPVKFAGVPAELARGLFPRGDDDAGQARLLQAYEELERVFSEELHKMSRHFHSNAFRQRSASRLCNFGSNDLCEALRAPLQVALQRAQEGKPYTLHIVQEWVNFYGFFDLGDGETSASTSVAKAVVERF